MPDNGSRKLTVTLPAGIAPAGGTAVLTLAIVDDKSISGGKRAISRSYRDANASDAGRIRRVEWEFGGGALRGAPTIAGAVGASLLSSAGYLGIDFCRNLETRWDRRLISRIKQTHLTLTGFDPPGTGSYFGTSYFGTAYFGGQNVGGQDVVIFDEQGGYLFAERGPLSTQVALDGSWSVINSVVLNSAVKDSQLWRGNVYLALGNATPMQRRTGVSAATATYEDVVSASPSGSVYASAVKDGSDRAWYIDAAVSTTFNFAGYTLDRFANLAAPFQVGDPEVGVNGIGPFGPLTDFGSAKQISNFTDQGKPVPLSRAINAISSPLNGSQFADPGFGWNYYLSAIGLRAHNLQGDDNPVGIGERMRGFTGHNGICIAIFAARGELWSIWQTSAGDLYGYRGVFGPETAETGQPLFFPWFYEAAANCTAIFSSTTPNTGTQNITIIRADGTNMTYETVAGNGRDDLAAPVYSTDGGVAYLTTFDKDPNLLKNSRLFRTRARHMTSGSSWSIAMAFDADPINPVGASYTNMGTITTSGIQTLLPVSAAAPITGISGYTAKPRITQVAAGTGASSSPPELDGTLEWEYDERPNQIEEIHVVVQLDLASVSDNLLWEYLRQMVGSTIAGPMKIRLPDDLPPAVVAASGGGQKYVMLQAVTNRNDITNPNIEAVELYFEAWPEAAALS